MNKETVTWVHHWTDKTFSFKTTRNQSFRFVNGEFAMIGLMVDDKPLVRAYSIASANYEDELEFLSIKVPDGPLTSRLQHLKVGDEVEIKPGVLNEKKKSYEPIQTEIVSLGTGAGIVDEVKPGGLVAIGTKLDPSMTSGDSFIGSVIGKPGTLPENSISSKMMVNLFDSAVGTGAESKVTPIQNGELLRLSIGTSPALCKVIKAKAENIEVEFRRPVCLFEGGSVAISRRISDRWRLIGAGIVG